MAIRILNSIKRKTSENNNIIQSSAIKFNRRTSETRRIVFGSY